mmetsp:Transcript_8301/g.17131  ORF Transcript_8301/g.17131 Transcript_8301/m.17131 type:complete len:87 (+) Transcript_8301:322-582(+)
MQRHLTVAAHETAALKLLLNFFCGTPSTSTDASGDWGPLSDWALGDQSDQAVEQEGKWESKPSLSFKETGDDKSETPFFSVKYINK